MKESEQKEFKEIELSRGMIFLFATACGVSVANLYYSQPLLDTISSSFKTTDASAGFVFSLALAGYTAGLLFIVPLGDIVSKRKLVLSLLCVVTLLLASAALSSNITTLGIVLFLLGAATVVPQVIVPLAVGLSVPAKRGAVVGYVMTGLLIGILLSRTLSGWVASLYGWRSVFWMASILSALLAFSLAVFLPEGRSGSRLSYPALLKSLHAIFIEHSLLRSSCAFGAASFAAFGIFWTTFSFLAAGAPYYFKPGLIGSFGLLGIAGCFAASITGRLVDRRGPLAWISVALLLVAVSFIIMCVFVDKIIWLSVGIFILDLGVQMNQVSNQTRIYTLPPEIHSRVNTVYMTSYFLGGSIGSALGTLAWAHFGWNGVCAAGLLAALLGLAVLIPHKTPTLKG
ncbi:MAG: MFS transporter [Candidatus Obscuribacterales bacterium]|nr:MFS transporter [Candidatus Obscuribacterales bacterium]